jgi:hypothetical protein
MGFNKRYISRESLKIVYKEKGAEGIECYLTKPDALIIDSDCKINLCSIAETIESIKDWISEEQEQEQQLEKNINVVNHGG